MKKIVLSLFLVSMLFLNVNNVYARVATDFCQTEDGNCFDEIENSNTYQKIQCGDTKIPKIAATLVHTVYVILQITVPILIVILGSLDFLKGVIAQKEDEIKKYQHIFIRRLILGAVVFVVFALAQLVIGVVAPHDSNEGMWNCVDCLVNGDC